MKKTTSSTKKPLKNKVTAPSKAAGKTAAGKKTQTRKAAPPVKAAPADSIVGKAEKLVGRINNVFHARPSDVVSAILEDHEALRNFLGLLKDTHAEMRERRRAYDQFSALLKSHTDVEEAVVYKNALELPGHEMHIKAAEGFVEHRLAEDLMKRLEAASDTTEWSAHANVLSEIVEHHLKEEERDLLPKIRQAASLKDDQDMLSAYLKSRQATQKKVTDKNAGVLKH